MAMIEDLSVFFNAAEFADSATLAGVAVAAIFDKAYTSAGVGAYGMAGTAPALTLATASVPADPVGLAAVVGGVSYTVAAHEPDGTGVSVLLLETA
jgi:hypothetical protein